MCESVERSTERHHASITTADVKRDAAERFLRDDYRRALVRLLSGEVDVVSTPAFRPRHMPITETAIEYAHDLSEDGQEVIAELLAIAYACAIDDDGVRARAVALITRLEDEHVSTHLDAAAEE